MANFFQKKAETIVTQQPQNLTLEEAVSLVRELINDKGLSNQSYGDTSDLMVKARKGEIEAIARMKEEIRFRLEQKMVLVESFTQEEIVNHIYAQNWGLGPVEGFYHQEDIVEIRLNRPDQIKVKYIGGRIETIPKEKCFKDEEDMERVIKNLSYGDTGESLDASTGKMEAVRPDGTRLTATCAPITKTWTAVLRKHTAFVASRENYIKYKTLNSAIWDIFMLLNAGRCNILYTGNVESGKTTFLREGIRYLDDTLRILSLGRDMEVRLVDMYPDRDIWEAEAHPEIPGPDGEGITMESLLHLALREGGDVLVMEEFRNGAEAIETLNALTRGMYGSPSTAHFPGAKKAVEGIVRLLHRDGVNLPGNEARVWIADAFQVVFHLEGDSITGRKLLVGITELFTDGEDVYYNDIVKWKPRGHHFFGDGDWITQPPSDKLIQHILKSVTGDRVKAVGWPLPGERESRIDVFEGAENAL